LAGLERFLCGAGFDRGPWLVVDFGAGIAAWFGLPRAGYWTGLILTCIAIALAPKSPWRGRDSYPHITQAVFALFLLVAAGCLTVWGRSAVVGQEPVARPLSGAFTGRILEVEEQPALERTRLVLAMRERGSGRVIKVRVNRPESLHSAQVSPGS
jgi:competence protein ComEC